MSFVKAAEFKVGMLVVIVGSLIAFMSMQISDDPSYIGRSKNAWFLLPSAGGLIKNSAVKTAGIPIGIIKDIRLEKGLARIDIVIKSEIEITQSAVAEIKSQGILGDKYIEINPGSLSDPPFAEGGQILNIKDQGSLDNIISQVGEITDSLRSVSKTLKYAVEENGDTKSVLGRIVLNIEKLSGDLAEMTSENKRDIATIVDQVKDITSSIQEAIKETPEGGLKKTMARLDNTMKSLDEITAKINNGEGTVGKLVSDEYTAEQVSSAIEGLNNLVDTGSKITTGIDFHADYLSKVNQTKSYIGVKIQPGLDRYYYVALINDPAGVVEKTTTKTTDNGSGSVDSDKLEEKKYYSKTKLTALYAKNFWNFTIRGGLIENTGGLGFDYHLLRKKLTLSIDAFDFQNLNLRTNVQYNLYHGVYLRGGVQDMLDKSEQQSAYLGAGLFITNDDLKLLLSKSSF